MSSFLEALRKAEKKNPGKQQKKPKGKDVPIAVVIPLVLLVSLVVFKMSMKGFSSPARGQAHAANVDMKSKIIATMKKVTPGYTLEGIICNDDNTCMTIINGEILDRQDKVGSMVVEEITGKTVSLRSAKDNSLTHLQLTQGSL